MPKPFSKLFEYEDVGQLLVVISATDPEIAVEFDPEIEGVGRMCSIQRFSSWEKADAAFEKMDADITYQLVKPTFDDAIAAFGSKKNEDA